MADVFLSYKREDAAKVRKLVAALRQAGLDTWWDEDIPPSAPWEATIEKQLAAAKAVIVCWSPDAVSSDNVRSEARVAREDGRLIQLFLKPCQPPLFFGEQQGLDLSRWRGNADDPRIARLAESVRKIAAGERLAGGGDRPRARRSWVEHRVHIAFAVLMLLAGGFASWWFLAPAKAQGPQTLAILPFRALNPADANLVDAIWDDTRGAISKNPNLRVLGRQAVTALAKDDLEPADYRKRVGADYLLDGNVQRAGANVLMNLSLTRTKDGAEVWSDSVGGKLDDVFAFQQRIAGEVEGRIRGRVAPNGGIKAQNIATSGQVYTIYADALALSKKRSPDSSREAITLLRKALAIDPNYAPAWAQLGIVANFVPRPANDPQEYSMEPTRYLKRALELAPNLARAHAALAMVQHFPPESESDLRQAVALDPGDAEAWMWLGDLLTRQNRQQEALTAYSRAVEIEPFFRPANGNLALTLISLGDWKGVDRVVERVAATRDPALIAHLQSVIAIARGRPGEALRTLLQIRSQVPETAAWVDVRTPALLQQLGFVEEAQRLLGNDEYVIADYRGVPEPAAHLWGGWKTADQIWKNNDAPALFGRILPRNGRLQEYVTHYRAAFPAADAFIAARSFDPHTLVAVAPTVAVALRSGGEQGQASEILGRTEPILTQWLKNGPPDPANVASLAFYRAAYGRNDQAVLLLARAVNAGWLPDNQYYALDIAEEPCFAGLVSRPDFQAIRRRIFRRIAEERRKVPMQLLAQAYPVNRQRAA